MSNLEAFYTTFAAMEQHGMGMCVAVRQPRQRMLMLAIPCSSESARRGSGVARPTRHYAGRSLSANPEDASRALSAIEDCGEHLLSPSSGTNHPRDTWAEAEQLEHCTTAAAVKAVQACGPTVGGMRALSTLFRSEGGSRGRD